MQDHNTFVAVDENRVTLSDTDTDIVEPDHSRNAQSTGHDGGMRSAAAHIEGNAQHAISTQRGRV